MQLVNLKKNHGFAVDLKSNNPKVDCSETDTHVQHTIEDTRELPVSQSCV